MLTYRRSDSLHIEGYTDSDYARDDRKSTLGYIFTLAGGAMMSIGPIFREVAGKFDFMEISMLAIRLQIRRDSNPATVTPLLRWLSTKHNLIDLAKKSCKTCGSK